MSSADPPPPPAQRSGLLRIALLVSLAFNLLVVGVVAGALVTRGGGMADRAVLLDLSFAPYTRALDESGRMAMREAWRMRSPEWRDLRATRRAEIDVFVAALRASPFDPTPVREILDNQQARNAAHQQVAHDVLVAHLESLGAAGRSGYADRLEDAVRGAMPRHGAGRH